MLLCSPLAALPIGSTAATYHCHLLEGAHAAKMTGSHRTVGGSVLGLDQQVRGHAQFGPSDIERDPVVVRLRPQQKSSSNALASSTFSLDVLKSQPGRRTGDRISPQQQKCQHDRYGDRDRYRHVGQGSDPTQSTPTTPAFSAVAGATESREAEG